MDKSEVVSPKGDNPQGHLYHIETGYGSFYVFGLSFDEAINTLKELFMKSTIYSFAVAGNNAHRWVKRISIFQSTPVRDLNGKEPNLRETGERLIFPSTVLEYKT